MAHSQKSIRDHARQHHHPHVNNEAIAQQLEALIKPQVYKQLAYYRSLGHRERILSLPLMVAALLTLLWRQVPSARELNRLLAREDLLWQKKIKVSQQALSQRLLKFPAHLFEKVLLDLLPELEKRWRQRSNRPLPVSVQQARKHFQQVWIVDASTLEALFRKLKSLKEARLGQLGGKICAVINLETRFPVKTWLESYPSIHETRFGSRLLDLLPPSTLLILDRGFWDFSLFEAIMQQRQSAFITRLKAGAKYEVTRGLSRTYHHRDQLIRLGSGSKGTPILDLRLVEIRHGNSWYRYVTSVVDPNSLPPMVVADLYAHRWRIEECFFVLKRLLGLSYLWTGSLNGIELQLWATWLFYVVLIDLADAVAQELSLPFERISVEMVFRGLYHFGQASAQGEASDPVAYLAAPENRDLGVVKAVRRKRLKRPPVDLSPFPQTQPLTS